MNKKKVEGGRTWEGRRGLLYGVALGQVLGKVWIWASSWGCIITQVVPEPLPSFPPANQPASPDNFTCLIFFFKYGSGSVFLNHYRTISH